ncbi:MAG: N-acetylmuramoyl-L-alanine amidase-like domain-containing protein [Arcobacteraceae bacterium]
MKKIFLTLILVYMNICASEYINFGKFEDDDSIFEQKDISKLSEKFLGIKYVSNTLKNDEINTSKENLVINFDALDCFTFIDTIEALKNAQDKEEFKQILINTRYKNGDVSYYTRNHFFSDWSKSNPIKDITCIVGECTKTVKYLNKDEKYLKEIPTTKREIAYINPHNIDLSLLKTGDYVGIYTTKKALDVTHTGIIIKKFGKVFIRHASSLKKKIIDSDLLEYTKNKIGLIIYRSL